MVYPGNVVVIDIGNDQIKIADISKAKSTIKVNKHAIIPTPDNSFSDGMLLEKELLAEAIRVALYENAIKNKKLVFTVSSNKIITREVEFPNLKLNKLRPIVENNAGDYFPVDLKEYTLDFFVSEIFKKDEEEFVKVNIVAAANLLMEEYVTLSKMINMNLAGIDYAGNSLYNFFIREQIEDTCLVANLGSNNVMVSIVSNKVLKFNRNLNFGTNVLIEYLMQDRSITKQEAIRITKEGNFLDEEKDTPEYTGENVFTAINTVINGIGRMIEFYTSRNKNKIDCIYLVGGGASIYGVSEYIEKHFEISVKIIKEFNQLSCDESFEKSNYFYANCIGAAVSTINLMPRLTGEEASSRSWKKISSIVLGTTFFIMLIWAVSMGIANMSLENKKEQLKASIAKAEEVQIVKQEYNKLKAKVDLRTGALEATSNSSEKYLQILEVMENKMPSKVFCTNLSDNGAGLELVCTAVDKITVAKYIETLKTMGFTEVYVPSITETGTEGGQTFVNFSVICKY